MKKILEKVPASVLAIGILLLLLMGIVLNLFVKASILTSDLPWFLKLFLLN